MLVTFFLLLPKKFINYLLLVSMLSEKTFTTRFRALQIEYVFENFTMLFSGGVTAEQADATYASVIVVAVINASAGVLHMRRSRYAVLIRSGQVSSTKNPGSSCLRDFNWASNLKKNILKHFVTGLGMVKSSQRFGC